MNELIFGVVGILCLGVVFLGNYVAGFSGHEPMLFFILGLALVAVEIFFFPGLMLLALPIIPPLQFYVGYPLRLATAFVSARLLSLHGLSIDAVGTCLDWNGTLIAVDAPCSGVRMLWTGLYLAMGLVLLYTLILYTMNFLVDLSYGILDPRVELK